MVIILNLETSTSVCSVSVAGDGEVLSAREQLDAKSHASQLIPFITEVLKESGLKPYDLSAIAVSKGPGSYTGLRIGVSTAKGMAYALNVPLIAIDTLYCMTSGYLGVHPELLNETSTLLCPMIDARRMEVYSAIYTSQLKLIRNTEAEIINRDSFHPLLLKNCIHFFGDGAMKCNDLIQSKSAVFVPDFHPSASFMGRITYATFKKERFENLAYFEPFYLKDFVATIPNNKMFVTSQQPKYRN
jgi:tRNA threonylcarbamoyladenosine biosynthesis protein TsaB